MALRDRRGAAGERANVDEAAWRRALVLEDAAEIGLAHRRRRMARHRGVAVEPEDRIAEAGEVLPEGGVAPELRHRREHRQEAAREDLARELDHHAEIADAARGVEGRAELVLDEAEAGVAEEAEGRADLAPHRLRPERAGDAGDADDVVLARLRGELLGVRMVEEHEGLQPMAVELRHVLGCAGEIVAVKGESAPVRFPPAVTSRHAGAEP